jgi:hypothetical protein
MGLLVGAMAIEKEGSELGQKLERFRNLARWLGAWPRRRWLGARTMLAKGFSTET